MAELRPENLGKVFKETQKLIYSRHVANSAEFIFEENGAGASTKAGCTDCKVF